MSRHAFASFAPLAPVDVARLRLCLPFSLSEQALAALALLRGGAGYALDRPRAGQTHETIELVVFDVERVLTEVLHFSPSTDLAPQGWLPVAGCGRRGRSLYFAQFGVVGFGELRRYRGGDGLPAQAPQLEPLGLTLADLLERAAPRSDLRVRRRLPHGPSAPAPARSQSRAKSGAARASRGEQRLLARNLSLF